MGRDKLFEITFSSQKLARIPESYSRWAGDRGLPLRLRDGLTSFVAFLSGLSASPLIGSSMPHSSVKNSTRPSIFASLILAWLGIVVCILLSHEHARVRAFLCPYSASCESVLTSPYSAILGVPLPVAGGGFYASILCLLLLVYGLPSPDARLRLLHLAHWMMAAGATFSLGLMYLQFGVLHAFCPLCTASAVIQAALFATTTWAKKSTAEELGSASPGGAVTIFSFALISSAALLLSAWSTRDEVIAVVDGKRIWKSQMEEELRAATSPLDQERYALELEWIDKKAEQMLLAREAERLQTTISDLQARWLGSPAAVSEEEVEARLRETGMPRQAENVARVRAEISDERRRQSRATRMSDLGSRYRLEILLKRPPVHALRADLAKAHLAGRSDARVQLVVFSDFQCPYCQRLAPIVKRIREEFPDDVLIAFRQFPLRSHPRAIPAAVAAECAAEQGAFWEYHDRLFSDGGNLSDEKLSQLAAAIGLDQSRFRQCLKTEPPRQRVEASFQDALKVGIEGAPVLYLNGLRVEGPMSYDRLVEKINAALAKPATP